MIQSADRPEIEFKVTRDVIESVNFAKFHGCYVTSNLESDFRTIGWLYHDAAWEFSTSFFQLSVMAISIKIGQVPHWLLKNPMAERGF